MFMFCRRNVGPNVDADSGTGSAEPIRTGTGSAAAGGNDRLKCK